MTSSWRPTPREVLFLAILFVFLLYFNSSRHPPLHDLQVQNTDYTINETLPSGNTLQRDHPQSLRTRLTWGKAVVPETKIIAHVPGWTIFDRLYIYKGIVYIVSDEPNQVPDLQFVYSKAHFIENGPEKEAARLPTDEDIRLINRKEARKLFGKAAQILDGVTLFVNDPPQFITHYYHWSAELWFGFWRTYSSIDTNITPNGNTTLPSTHRILFNHLDAFHWRDYASMNQWVVRSSFPGVNMEFVDDWRDRAEMNTVWAFDRVILADRSAAMLGYNYARYQRTAGVAFALPGAVDWWMSIRDNVVGFTGTDINAGSGTINNPVITYISRQSWGRRMLIQEDHEKLVRELYKLKDTYGWEVNVIEAENLSRVEQIRLAARTTILMGVHGNGLTSLIWMKPTPRSTVMEFFYPGGFAHDYEYTTRAVGMVHYGFWGSEFFTSPSLPTPAYPEGFQGTNIPIDGEVVARLCVERLTLASEIDD
ncbi:hypothetical protein AMATHDRAFT_79208 [Amanita thiersii Skay4041]|uniref:Glycosyltransferase 61 catalytic domain-containing protein n=1 Tax=Amanita thiersii Skay4041 TaxID=703135 RepID=A0A2A9NR01_9AGAR|nr:hypothetical protein AMATHDRAFT_79208 [Amanita thiersii Skay4041]